MNSMLTIDETARLIESGASLSIAGNEAALDALPQGEWIGGTTAYAMLAEGGTALGNDHVFVTTLSSLGDVRLTTIAVDGLASITGDAPENGFTVIIIPAGSEIHAKYAVDATQSPDAFVKPTVGWISGTSSDRAGTASAKVYDGRIQQKYEDRAVVAQVTLPAHKLANIEILNIFEPDGGDILTFPEISFEVHHCNVNGERTDLASYLKWRGAADGHLPLIGDFSGAKLNVSIQRCDGDKQGVQLYAPVYPGVDYCLAKPVENYTSAFLEKASSLTTQSDWSCNCILNFNFGSLEGRSIGGHAGPVTFGEIAYQLLNQTLVLLTVVDIS